ncbi:MAG: 50S ribosomal protein L22 [Erysipelotrichia bacterium]|nr:50S ribosomal protein L22 [Erysipelotrichia bacterium]
MATAKKVKSVEEPTEVIKEETPKKVRKEKKESEKPAKPPVTEAKAIAKNIRVTPRKARLVVDVIRGKDVKEALGILANVNKAATTPVIKVIKSAAANATNNFGMDEEKLYIDTIYVNDGMRIKRYLPRAKGSASGLVKRACNITVIVKMR